MRQAWHLTVLNFMTLIKISREPNCVSCYQNIGKHLILQSNSLTEKLRFKHSKQWLIELNHINKKTEFRVFHYPYLPTPPLGQDMTQGQFLSGV